MYGNDRLGYCMYAAACHADNTFTGNVGSESTFDESTLEPAYEPLSGGDNGPALVPGRPDKSRLIEAVGYGNVDLRMPPKGKLPDAVVSDLAAWVKMGAPWPDGETKPAVAAKGDFDLQARKRSHWAWQPIHPQSPPAVKNSAWPRDPIDRLLARSPDRLHEHLLDQHGHLLSSRGERSRIMATPESPSVRQARRGSR